MRITLHIGAFTVTIVIKRRNRHPGRWRFLWETRASTGLTAWRQRPFSISIIGQQGYAVKHWVGRTRLFHKFLNLSFLGEWAGEDTGPYKNTACVGPMKTSARHAVHSSAG